MWLSNLAVRRPVLVVMLIAVFVVLGIASIPRLPVELLPEVNVPYLMVRVVYPGAGPQDVESGVVEPLEEVLGKINGLKTLRSTAVPDAGIFILELAMGTDASQTVNEVQAQIDAVSASLPPGIRKPTIQPINLNASPVMLLALTGDLPPAELTEWARDNVVDPFSRLEGVATVDLVGGRDRELIVEVDQQRLLSHRLGLANVVEAVRAGGQDIPAGTLLAGGVATPVRTAASFVGMESLSSVRIKAPLGEVLGLAEIAAIYEGLSPEETRARVDGRPALGLAVFKRADANTVALGNLLRQEISGLEPLAAASGIGITLVQDASTSIRDSIQDLLLTMGPCILLTALVLYVFLHDWRGTVIVATAMPASLVGSLGFIWLSGFTINYMTLMGLALTIGTLVDASIVVLESISRESITEGDAARAADRGTANVILGVLGSITTNIAVFLPIAFMKGIVGQFFVQFALTVTYATAISLLVSFTLVPAMAAWLYRERSAASQATGPFARAWDSAYGRSVAAYQRLLRLCLRHRALALLWLGALLGASFAILGPLVSMGFFANPDQGFFVMELMMPRGTDLDATTRAVERVEAILREDPAIGTVYGEVGRYNTLFGFIQGTHRAELHVVVQDADRSTASVLDDLRPRLAAAVPGADLLLKELGGGENALRDDFMVEITGPDPAVLSAQARRIEAALEAQPNVVDIFSHGDEVSSLVQVSPDRDRIARLGLHPAQVGLLLRAAIEGDTQARVRLDADTSAPIRVRLGERDRRDLASLAATTIQTASGAQVPLRELGRVEEVIAPSMITRQDRTGRATVTANLAWGAVGETSARVAALLDQEPTPQGYHLRVGGEEEQRAEAAREMGKALILSVVLIYMLLAAMLESFVHPFTIMSSLPLAAIGVLFMLAVGGVPLDIFGLMAIVMLVGIVVNNAILMIEQTRHGMEAGLGIEDALVEGSALRLKAILMTSLTTVVGMIPLALAIGAGANLRQSMALVSIGGVGFSTVLVLVACPVIYHLVEGARSRE